ncbi:MAG: 50S ribosomal protein L35 [Eubacteriales bacterium]|nr:50S ribosomal protein L35 [Bacillota bacterium]MBV1726517.1 50S ribosomal protein L35 [Desulforudis sp.]MDP3050350.1 50S ribosomal protein L35 [Eubacteriales bacterium]MBU4532044.1 50S ribosomal protein L35 [Bacillota bacterium]MBU4554432.1 50S ribosomal protein L35 [Bacillota bacterium]
MPKMKTHRAAAKRFKRTGTGKLRSYHAFSSHKLESKTAKRKRRLRGTFILSPGDMARLRSLLPYKA